MKKHLLIVCLLLAGLVSMASAQSRILQPLTTFGPNGDGTMLPGQTNGFTTVDFTSGGAERAIAYNPTTGHLLVVARTNSFDPLNFHIYVLDGATGTNILVVSTNGANQLVTNALELDVTSDILTGGNSSFTYNMIAVADDGAIYVANLSNVSAPPQYRLYRWANETAPEVAVYFGDPGNGNPLTVNRRWGDTLAIRGAGASTQILTTSRGTIAALMTPPSGTADAFSNPWTATTLQTDVPLSVGLAYGLSFGPGNTFYSKAASSTGNPLVLLSFDTNAGTATTLQTYSLSNFPGRTAAIGVLPASNILVGIEPVVGNDYVRMYDISNPATPPVQLDRQQFTTNAANDLFAGSITFGNGNVYVLDNDNGVRAFKLASGTSNSLSPTFIQQPTNITIYPNPLGVLPTNAVFAGTADGTAPVTYQWFQGGTTAATTTNLIVGATNTTYSYPNPSTNDNGKTFAVVASNSFGAVTSSVAVLGVSATAPVTLPWYESFNYAVGSMGTNGGWNIQSGSAGNVVAGNLSVPGLPAAIGNTFSWLNGTMSYRLPFGIYSSGTVYYSIAIKITSLSGFTTPPGTLCGFANGTGTTFMKLNLNTNGLGQYFLGCSIGSSPVTYATNLHNVGDTVFVVQSYTFTGGASDLTSIWDNPDPSTFSAASAPTPTVSQAGALPSLDRFFFRHSGGSQPSGILGDELRIGLAWSDVTPQAPPVLSVAFDGTNAVVSWPSSYSGYGLQGSTNIAPTSWGSVTNSVNLVGTNNVVSVKTTTNKTRFFRLLK